MIDPKFHKQEIKDRFVSPIGFLGAGSDNYRSVLGYQHGEDPYRMMKLNPDFVRISKGEDGVDPHDPLHITNAPPAGRNA